MSCWQTFFFIVPIAIGISAHSQIDNADLQNSKARLEKLVISRNTLPDCSRRNGPGDRWKLDSIFGKAVNSDISNSKHLTTNKWRRRRWEISCKEEIRKVQSKTDCRIFKTASQTNTSWTEINSLVFTWPYVDIFSYEYDKFSCSKACAKKIAN